MGACSSSRRKSSVRFAGGVVNPRLIGDPVDLPGLAAVVGEGLLEMGCVGSELGPVKANQDRLAVDGVLRVELADAVLELANLGRVENADLLVIPIESPLVGCGVVHAQGQADDAAAGAIPLALIDLGAVE